MSTEITEAIEYDFFASQFGRGKIAANTCGYWRTCFHQVCRVVSWISMVRHFKLKSALRHIPFGQTVNYQQFAQRMGHPRAARAVGNAVARNRITYLVPCHRVIRADGLVGAYRWGVARKSAMLAWECCATDGSLRQVGLTH